MLIHKGKNFGQEHFNNFKALIEYSSDMDNRYKNIEECNLNKKHKILIASDEMIVDILSNKKPNLMVTELFIRGSIKLE